MEIRLCKYCNIEKIIDLFPTANQCSDCRKKKQKEINSTPKARLKQKERRQRDKEKNKLCRQKWAEKNREKDNNYKRKWRANNKEKEYLYQKNRLKTNAGYRITQNLRHRIWLALEGNIKSKKTKQLLGCSIEEFKKHLESKFTEGMFWDNYGENGWHVGHIIPCKFFDLSNSKEQEICFNFKNLRPEWEIDNIINNDKIPDGRRARDMSREQKLNYLRNLGHNL